MILLMRRFGPLSILWTCAAMQGRGPGVSALRCSRGLFQPEGRRAAAVDRPRAISEGGRGKGLANLHPGRTIPTYSIRDRTEPAPEGGSRSSFAPERWCAKGTVGKHPPSGRPRRGDSRSSRRRGSRPLDQRRRPERSDSFPRTARGDGHFGAKRAVKCGNRSGRYTIRSPCISLRRA